MVESLVEVVESWLNRVLSLTKPVKPPAAAGVPIRGIFSKAEIGNSEPLLQVFSLVAGDGAETQGSDTGNAESHWERLSGTGKDGASGFTL